jgi:UDP-N-acetyl-D-glucosamine dehydrogenase
MKVAIIGQGYVGLTISLFASQIHDVIGFDTNQTVVDALNKGISHIEGVDSESLRHRITEKRYRASSDPQDISDCEIVIIAVPTPLTKDRKPDLKFIDSACLTIAKNLNRNALIINESTSFPGTLRDYIKPNIEKNSRESFNHLYAISPERVDPGRGDFNQKNTPRLYAGLTPEAGEQVFVTS